MTKKSILVVVSVVITSAIALCIFDPRVPIFFLGSQVEGSPRFARHWRERLAAIDNPDEFVRQYRDREVDIVRYRDSEVGIVRCKNGEWATYAIADSHSSLSGGTVVMKDSSGRIRAFFGYVCGHGFMMRFSEIESLDEFYADYRWTAFNFHEYTYPD